MSSIEEFNTSLVYFSILDQYIKETNADGHSYTLGPNQFFDWSQTEYRSMLEYKVGIQEVRFYTYFDESTNADTIN